MGSGEATQAQPWRQSRDSVEVNMTKAAAHLFSQPRRTLYLVQQKGDRNQGDTRASLMKLFIQQVSRYDSAKMIK